MIVSDLLILIGAYVVGSLPTGYLIAYSVGIQDIRQYGSGNIGATNVARMLGGRYFIPVFCIDAGKAAAYLLYMQSNGYDEFMLVASAALLLIGNAYSLFLSFTGGKGFATTLGIIAVLAPWTLLVIVPVWVAVVAVTHTVGIASSAACVSLSLGAYFFTSTQVLFWLFFCMGFWGLLKHRDNLKRYISR